MGRYSAGFTKAAPATATMVAQLRTSSTKDVRVWEVGVFASTAVALSVGLIRSATVGATFTSVTPTADDTSLGAASTLVDTAATTAPTISTNVYLRKIVLPATIGAGIIWSFPMGIVVPTSGGLLLWNFGAGTGPAIEGYYTFEE